MIRECIILAGGLGTRLRSTVPDLPKCMAGVAGKPFVDWIIAYLRDQGIERFVFSLGYMHEVIESHIYERYPEMHVRFAVETEPLGTGGGIRLACQQAADQNALIVNGDTLFKADLSELGVFHKQQAADCTLALKPMFQFDRYGAVTTDDQHRITVFREKQWHEQGNINGGIYVLNRVKFLQEDLPLKFSFEKDYLEAMYPDRRIFGLVQDAYFIDIGIPEDYNKANEDFKRL